MVKLFTRLSNLPQGLLTSLLLELPLFKLVKQIVLSSLSRPSKGLNRSKAHSAHEVGGRHIRVHCSCKFISSGDDWTTPEEEDTPKAPAVSTPQGMSMD